MKNLIKKLGAKVEKDRVVFLWAKLPEELNN